MKKYLGAAVLSILLFSQVYGLEKTYSNLVMVLHEDLGRFSLYKIVDDSGTRTPLIVDQDPRTSFLSILVGNRIYRMGDAFDFRQEIVDGGDLFGFRWTSKQLVVSQMFGFSGTDNPSVSVQVEIRNVSDNTLDVGTRYLLDTSLGEDGIHFRTPSGEVTKETEFVIGDTIYVESAKPDNSVSIRVSGTSVPDRIVAANWKRLNDTPWTFAVNAKRNFSLLPYSVDDSALCVYFDPRKVSGGGTMTVGLVLETTGGAVVAAKPAPTTPAVAEPVKEPVVTEPVTVEPTPEPEESAPPVAAAVPALSPEQREALSDLDVLLRRIDALLEQVETATEAELGRIAAELAAIEAEMEGGAPSSRP